MPVHANHLAGEKSPYLLQHAHNPVDWYPWGDAAFEKAQAEDKPVFLSIGYSTCHWCHVMERESFENPEIARLLNETFVCVKVDREERPDIDQVYMAVCQMLTGSGGWPLTILMTPGKKPFYAATYIPPDSRYGRMGLRQLAQRVSDLWKNDREGLEASAGKITEALIRQSQASPESGADPARLVEGGYRGLMRQYDPTYGGFGTQPKFPSPHQLLFLLRLGRPDGVAAVEHTLVEMRKGGIFDQIGFGFHRYSTDRRWLVPHFEKMLYDQAMLALAYTEAWERTGKPLYRQTAEEILAYLLRDMRSPDGAFFSAEDADSEGVEGLFYTWTAAEMKSVLGTGYPFAARLWNIREEGNYRDEATGNPTGRNIPYLGAIPPEDEAARVSNIRKRLFAVRERRVHPAKDTKVLADWNGLAIAALARAGRSFGEPRYLRAALRASGFVREGMQRPDGSLWHRWCGGQAAIEGNLNDYAFQIFGQLELYDATRQLSHLEAALASNDILEKRFRDPEQGGYFMVSSGTEPLLVRPKAFYDGALPSGNSMQLLNLYRLARLTGRPELEQRAEETRKAFGEAIAQAPSAFSWALCALLSSGEREMEVVVVGPRDAPATKKMLEAATSAYAPGRTVLLKDPDEADRLAKLAPFTTALRMVDGKPTAYLCTNFSCKQPVTDPEKVAEQTGN